MSNHHNDYIICPHCGGEVKRNAKACSHCGSDDTTGWSTATYLDGIDLQEDISYEEIRENEFGERTNHGKPYRMFFFVVVASIVLILFIAGTFLAFRF